MSSWGCPHEVNGICKRVRGAICEPGMRGCVLVGKVQFAGGVIPAPRWPTPTGAETATPGAERPPATASRRRRTF